MSVDSKKTILLEKKYLYVRASLGFQLEGTSTEIIPTNNGFYRFYVDNLSKALGNSYVNIIHDSKDLAFQSFCSDLYMDELMSSDSSAIEDVVLELKKNTLKIEEFENGVSSALQSNHEDNVATVEKINEFQVGVSSAFASNHEDNVAISTVLHSSYDFSSFYLRNNQNFSLGSISGYRYNSSKTDYKITISPQNRLKDSFVPSWHFHEEIYNNLVSSSSVFLFHLTVNGFDSISSAYGCFLFCKIKCLNKAGELQYRYDNYYNFNSNSYTFSFSDISVLLSYDIYVFASDLFLNSLIFYCGGDEFNLSSFSNNRLILFGLDSFVSSCNQNFNYDFKGGYLDFKFYSNIDIAWLKSWNYVFITDGGKCSFSGNDLGLTYDTKDTSLVVCSTLPNIVPSFSCNKLLGIRVNKTGKF